MASFGRTAGGASAGSLKRGGTTRQFGNSAGYEATASMNFRGQDKKQPAVGQLGNNPNLDPTDDYIVNLQQQIHFMDLELKILREKVVEDEQKSGIGSLYDDDKTSHQHISLLKTKYAQLRRDFDRQLKDLQKQSLKVKGQEFVLDANLSVIKEQTHRLKQMEATFMEEFRIKQNELQTQNRDGSRNQMHLEGELKQLSDHCYQGETIHFEHKIHQDKEKEFSAQTQARHELEVKLVTALRESKVKLEKETDDALDKVEKEFLAKAEYQKALTETEVTRTKIEEDKVMIQFLDIQVHLLSEATEYLVNKIEELAEEKKLAESKNDEMKTQAKAQEEIANKRLQNKLNREKSAAIKDLLANEEMVKQNNEDIQNKFRSEKDNYDNLLKDKMELEEKLKRLTAEFTEDTKEVDEQDKLLAELKKQIEAEQADVDKLNEEVDEAKKVKKVEEERNRQGQQQFTHLSAKFEFIETHYDYTSDVDGMSLEIFNKIVDSNKDFNTTVGGFLGELQSTKAEVSTIISQKSRVTF